jgi:hypothetical protein
MTRLETKLEELANAPSCRAPTSAGVLALVRGERLRADGDLDGARAALGVAAGQRFSTASVLARVEVADLDAAAGRWADALAGYRVLDPVHDGDVTDRDLAPRLVLAHAYPRMLAGLVTAYQGAGKADLARRTAARLLRLRPKSDLAARYPPDPTANPLCSAAPDLE